MQDANDRGWLFDKAANGRAEGPNIRAITTCALEIAQGMAYLHEKGCLHRDLTAGNVLLAATSAHPWGFTCKVCSLHAALCSLGVHVPCGHLVRS